jgi:hypothetical protein
MKSISLVFLVFILALTFTASDMIVEKGNKPDAASKCPYLENLQQNNAQLQCPYLNGNMDGSSSCPYLNENNQSQTGCPYLDGAAGGECPYLKQKGQEASKKIEYLPLPEGKNT